MLNSKKTYYSIREVCDLTGLEPHVLRYWESEFSLLRPKKNRAGNRAYREKDIEIILMIKRLLYEEKFTIPGAKIKLAEQKEFDDSTKETEKPPVQKDVIKDTIGELKDVLNILSSRNN